ncbi:hypothetical protein VNO78_11094 [Psophocarpus tetragonolobus]|uniref:Uncharacterized protein n=1 Tax=Psophocarpus tetragonolobus TaxID=3891 RepID=A0AAN9SKU0_PSOTE
MSEICQLHHNLLLVLTCYFPVVQSYRVYLLERDRSATSQHWNGRFSSCTVRVSPTDEDDADNCFRAAIVNSQTLEEVARLKKLKTLASAQ